jgi:hypothetical protein
MDKYMKRIKSDLELKKQNILPIFYKLSDELEEGL